MGIYASLYEMGGMDKGTGPFYELMVRGMGRGTGRGTGRGMSRGMGRGMVREMGWAMGRGMVRGTGSGWVLVDIGGWVDMFITNVCHTCLSHMFVTYVCHTCSSTWLQKDMLHFPSYSHTPRLLKNNRL